MLVELFLNILLLFFILRLLESSSHLNYYNPYYQYVIKITEPVLKLFRYASLSSKRDYSALWGILLILALKTFFYMANQEQMSEINLVFSAVYFKNVDLWECLMKGILMFILFYYKLLVFMFLFACLAEIDDDSDHFSRTIKALISPVENLTNKIFIVRLKDRLSKILSLLVLTLLFAAIVYLILILNQEKIVLSTIIKRTYQMNFLQLFWSGLAISVEVFSVFIFLIVVRVISSWFISPNENRLVQMIYMTTQPLLTPFERLDLRLGFIDLTPMISLLFLLFMRQVCFGILSEAYRLF